ncbi:hypothetical protein H5410_032912 [Solanum commersonii]|uniref:Gag1-like clamp domain-containing protein n=1 Tax=Solanum commersonii TaxID=4109 RepID=A0A9J5YRK9_SOLCO|nr:hypothetical protein H5410_032912 [Solanum commersonii]
MEVDNPSDRSKLLRKTSLSDDFWSPRTSACEMEGRNSEFLNHGLILWNQTRQQWRGNKTPQKNASVGEPKLSLYTSYEMFLETNKLFPQPIPLPEMVDFLVDVWEQEGLYDKATT